MTVAGSGGRRRSLPVACLLVGLLAIAPYLGALRGEFVLDDVAFYVDNPEFTAGGHPGRFFTSSYWQHSAIESPDPLYRPLMLTVMWVNQSLFGQVTAAHHLFNVLVHALASLLLLLLLRRLLPDAGVWPATAGALLFAVHPVHVEAVAWIIAYGHLLASCLLFGAMLAYLRHLERGSAAALGGALVLFALALLTMEVAVSFPLILVAHDRLRHRRISATRLLPFVTVLIAYFVARRMVLGQVAPLDLGSPEAWRTAAVFAAGYIKHLFVPWPQFVYLSLPEGRLLEPLSYLLVMALLLAAGTVLWGVRSDAGLLAFGALWTALALAAPLLAAFSPRPLFALRSLYLPSAGLGMALAWAVARPLRRHRALAVGLVAAAVAGSFPITVAATRDWTVNLEVYRKILSVTPRSPNASLGLGDAYMRRGDDANAERYFLRAAEHARDRQTRRDSYERLGLLHGTRGRIEASERYYGAVLGLDPHRSSAWVGLGNNAWARGDPERALNAYLRAFRTDGANHEACHNIGLAYRRLGDEGRALHYLRLAERIRESRRR